MGRERGRSGAEQTQPISLRCAIYTRVSTEEGLNQEFNTLEAQRESAEAYVRSQLHVGWTSLAERYDDGGFTGANLARPALRKLLMDIEAGRIDCIVVYKIDRLSRSLLDFARLMEILERRQVNLVSVTQPLNTTSSLGRLTLNILLSYAEFELTIVSDRTRDKMAAARRKGKWVGGTPVLGYDIAETGGKLLVNVEEAHRVQEIFTLYLQHRSVKTALAEIRARNWTTKQWRTREGKEHAGGLFTKAILERLLSNVIYIGKISYQDALYAGEQKPVIEEELWKQVSEKLVQERNHDAAARKTSGTSPRHSSAIAERSEPIPRITRLLALALKFEELIRSGSVSNYAALAQVAQVSRSRVTQMTSLLNLAPDIQEEILFLTAAEARERGISEPSLRKLTATLLWTQQREQWKSLRRFSRNVQR